jgi:hypothetical protein
MKTRIAIVPMFALLVLSGAALAQDTPSATPEAQPAAIEAQAAATEVRKDTLLIERVQEENKSAMPTRGQTMTQVEARYGAPADKLDPRGGQKRQWPTINRWVYPAFTVYFEKSRVIDVVANKADEQEIGPKPPVK